MAKYKRIITAGPLVIEAVYPAPNPRDSEGVRAGKRALSTEAKRLLNLKCAYQKLELLIAANFTRGDLYLTLTYDDAHLPPTRKAAVANMHRFWRRMRAARQKEDKPLSYIYVTEHRHGEGRWHHHALINSTGGDLSLLQMCWPYGRVELRRIRIDRDYTFETLARYLCKEERDKPGLRLWSSSSNLRKPQRECCRVPNDTPLSPPPGVTVLADNGDVRTAYGHYRYIKYYARGLLDAPAPKAKRRRKRRR